MANDVEDCLRKISTRYTGREAAVNSALAIIDFSKDTKLDYDFGGTGSVDNAIDSVAGKDGNAFASWAVNRGLTKGFSSKSTSNIINTGEKTSYTDCKPGDLLIKHSGGSGKMLFIVKNDNPNQKFIVAEANDNNNVELSEYTYSKLSGTFVARDMSQVYGD